MVQCQRLAERRRPHRHRLMGTVLKLTVPNEMVEEAVALYVANDLGIDPSRVDVLRITRKKGGGVEADVGVAGTVPLGDSRGRTDA